MGRVCGGFRFRRCGGRNFRLRMPRIRPAFFMRRRCRFVSRRRKPRRSGTWRCGSASGVESICLPQVPNSTPVDQSRNSITSVPSNSGVRSSGPGRGRKKSFSRSGASGGGPQLADQRKQYESQLAGKDRQLNELRDQHSESQQGRSSSEQRLQAANGKLKEQRSIHQQELNGVRQQLLRANQQLAKSSEQHRIEQQSQQTELGDVKR